MNATRLTLAVLVCATASIVAHAQQPSASACTVLNPSHRAQFITYERASDSDVYLRLHNNVTCHIVVETNDQTPLRSGAGRFVGLHYLVHDRRRQTLRVGFGWGDSIYTVILSAGDSVTFAVPRAQLKKRLDVVVPFNYPWDGDNVSAQTVGGIRHLVYFFYDDLPPLVLSSK